MRRVPPIRLPVRAARLSKQGISSHNLQALVELSLVEKWSDVRDYLRADFRSMGVPFSFRTLAFDPVARFVCIMRLHALAVNTRKPAFIRIPLRLWFRSLSVKLGFSIGPNVFGPGVAIVHYGLLIIDPTTRIGKNCRVHMGVHLGGSSGFVAEEELADCSPRLGNNVYLAPGCKIYGPVIIGDDCVVGANAVVTKSFPERGHVLAGSPARVIATRGSSGMLIQGAK
jgi:serine O-acetyltransferase